MECFWIKLKNFLPPKIYHSFGREIFFHPKWIRKLIWFDFLWIPSESIRFFSAANKCLHLKVFQKMFQIFFPSILILNHSIWFDSQIWLPNQTRKQLEECLVFLPVVDVLKATGIHLVFLQQLWGPFLHLCFSRHYFQRGKKIRITHGWKPSLRCLAAFFTVYKTWRMF